MGKKKTKSLKLKKPPVLFSKTQKIVKAIEKELSGTFVTYWTSTNGSVCQNDVVGFYEILEKIGLKDELLLFVKSDGGNGEAALRIVNLLRQYVKKLTVLLPLECASAATMLALGADEIQMGPLAFLTAIDTSITHELSPIDKDNDPVSVSQDELNRCINLWREEAKHQQSKANIDSNAYSGLYSYVHPLVIGAVDRSSSLSVRLCTEILRYHTEDQQKAEHISHELNSAYPSHTYPIILREAQRLGLKATELPQSLNTLLLELHELYSEMGQQALTDYDELNYHNNEILNILESADIQIYYQLDKDWHYRKEERNWVPMNDNSSWRRIEKTAGKTVRSVFHIR